MVLHHSILQISVSLFLSQWQKQTANVHVGRPCRLNFNKTSDDIPLLCPLHQHGTRCHQASGTFNRWGRLIPDLRLKTRSSGRHELCTLSNAQPLIVFILIIINWTVSDVNYWYMLGTVESGGETRRSKVAWSDTLRHWATALLSVQQCWWH